MRVVASWIAARRARKRVQTILDGLAALDVPEPSIDLAVREPVIAPRTFKSWRRWGEARARPLWQAFNAEGIGSRDTEVPEHRQLLETQEQEAYSCDLRDVDGIFRSRGEIEKLTTIEEFARRDRAAAMALGEEVLPVSPSSVDRLIDSVLVRHGGELDFVYCRWERRLYLNEGDGSHRFAAAQLMATELGLARKLPGRCVRYSIASSAVEALRRRFRVVQVGKDAEFWLAFHELMASQQVPWFQVPMPQHGWADQLIGFPADELGGLIAELMIKGGARDFLETLSALATRCQTPRDDAPRIGPRARRTSPEAPTARTE